MLIEIGTDYQPLYVPASLAEAVQWRVPIAWDHTLSALAVAMPDRVLVYQPASRTLLAEISLPTATENPKLYRIAKKIAFSACGRRLVVERMICDEDHQRAWSWLEVYSRPSMSLLFRYPASSPVFSDEIGLGWQFHGSSSWALSPDGALLAIGDYSGNISVIDSETGVPISPRNDDPMPWFAQTAERSARSSLPAKAISFSRDSKTIAVCFWDSWNRITEVEMLHTHDLQRRFAPIRISPDRYSHGWAAIGPTIISGIIDDVPQLVLTVHDNSQRRHLVQFFPPSEHGYRSFFMGDHSMEQVLTNGLSLWMRHERNNGRLVAQFTLLKIRSGELLRLTPLQDNSLGKYCAGAALSHDGSTLAALFGTHLEILAVASGKSYGDFFS